MTLPQDINPMMIQGKLLGMESALLSDLNDGIVKANQIVRTCIETKTKILETLVQATTAAGVMNALSQEINGAAGLTGGICGVVGGAAGLAGSYNEFKDLRNIDNMTRNVNVNVAQAQNGVQVNVVQQNAAGLPAAGAQRPLSDAEKEIEKAKIAKKWEGLTGLTGLGQILNGLGRSGGELAGAPITATAACEQANSQKSQSLQETASSQMGSTESAAQNAQGFFGQAANLPASSCQWMVILAQAH
jgi:hypothetical protein